MSFKISGAWNRMLEAEAVQSFCQRCHRENMCLVVDGSEGEYGEVALCEACISALFQEGLDNREEREHQPKPFR